MKEQEFTIKEDRLKSGLTPRSFMAILYTFIIFQPALIYLSLVTPAAIGGMVGWATLILFTELTKLSGKRLTKQEAGIIFLCANVVGASSVFTHAIFNLYLRVSPVVAGFGLTNLIPSWVSPTSLEPWIRRTFFHVEWSLPFAVWLINFVTSTVAGISMGFFLRHMFIVVERLPFPLQQPPAQLVLTLTGKESRKMGILSTTTVIAFVYGTVLYGIPFIWTAMQRPVSFIPIPWVDLNQWIHMVLPGASFGLATDMIMIGMGFLIPFNLILSGLIGSIIVFVIGNWLLVTLGISRFAEEWAFGMSIQRIWQRSLLNFWISPLIGVGIAAGIIPLIRHPGIIMGTIQSLKSRSLERVRLLKFFIVWLAAAVSDIALIHYLVPRFPLWILIFLTVIWTPLITFISMRSMAMTGLGIDIPYVRNMLYLASGYEGIDIWFAPVGVPGGGGWVTQFKIADLLDIEPVSFVKAYMLALPLALLFGFVYVSYFWSVAPIPSATYPAAEIYWPIQITQMIVWITHPPELFRIEYIIGSFIISAAVYLICEFLRLPFSLIALAAGMNIPIPTVITVLIGGILGKMISRIIGRNQWDQNKAIVAAGLNLGEGLAVVISSFLAMMIKGMWYMPY